MTSARSLTDGVWVIDHPEFSMMGLRLGTRTTILRLDDGTLAVHSPGPLNDAGFAAIRALGEVSHLVAPNLMHNLYVEAAAAAFPQAKVLAVAGLKRKRPSLRVDEVLDGTLPAALSGTLALQRLEGAAKLDEHVLFHPASKTLIGVDLAFNLHGATGFTRFAMAINGANERFCVTRLARSQFIDDARAAGDSVRRMADAWDVQRVIVAHGDVLENGGREALREAWRFSEG